MIMVIILIPNLIPNFYCADNLFKKLNILTVFILHRPKYNDLLKFYFNVIINIFINLFYHICNFYYITKALNGLS